MIDYLAGLLPAEPRLYPNPTLLYGEFELPENRKAMAAVERSDTSRVYVS